MPQTLKDDIRMRAFARFSVLAVAAVTGLVIAFGSPPPAIAGQTCPVTEMTSASQPACWRPFADNSLFNTPLPSDPKLVADSSTIASGMASNGWAIQGTSASFSMTPVGTHPLFFATPSDPTMKIQCTNALGSGSCTGANGVDVDGKTINIPAGAEPYDDSDGHLTVIETATGSEYDFWEASTSGSTIVTGTGSEMDVNNGDGRGAQGDAAFLGLSGGVIRPSELAAGQIDHALAITVPCTSGSGSAGFVWPAVRGDGSPCGPNGSAANEAAPALGQLLHLNMTDAQIAASGAPAWEKTIMTALAHYGAFVEDTGGGEGQIGILTQSSSSWTDVGQPDQWAVVAKQFGIPGETFASSVPIPVGDLQAVDPCVPEGLCVPPPASASPPSGQSGAPSNSGGAKAKHKRHHKHKKHKRHGHHKRHKHRGHHKHKKHKHHGHHKRHKHHVHHGHRHHKHHRHHARRG